MSWFASALVAAMTVGGLADPPESKTGIKVGEKAPAFKLKDQNGKERELAALLKERPVALVFYRSADW